MFEKSKNFEIHGGTFIDASSRTFTGRRSGIDRLHENTIPEAAHDSHVSESKARCLEGTRTQYIEDITTWMNGINQLQQRRLLWMCGPAGVGKSAVAKSCAEKTAGRRMLGASFFFSRDNGVYDPVRFFTTIAYQLAINVPGYKKIVGARVEDDYDLPKKGLEVQFRELIIAPFLELARWKTSVDQWAVFVDGLDECDSDRSQCKIIELVVNSVAAHGDKVPLLWAFFSRPERHIHDAFSPYFNLSLFWKVELPVSRDYDSDIRLYFHDALRLPTTITSAWPSEEDLDILVKMVAGLFIYAVTVVRFIMDPDSLSPRRQLVDVLAFYSQLQAGKVQLTSKSTVTDRLDGFYMMIMGRISPKLLPVIQQVLLIHSAWSYSPIHDSANILGLTVEELENCFSKLRSVLTFDPRGGGPLVEPFPGSAQIILYHASFMEFLCNPERSREYCIEDQHHYTSLAVKAVCLFKELYTMNGFSRGTLSIYRSPMASLLGLMWAADEKIQKLRKRLSVFPGEDFTSSECLIFQDHLLHSLAWFTLGWCARSGLPSEVMEVLEEINLEECRDFFRIINEDMNILPEEKQTMFRLRKRQWELEDPQLPRNLGEDVDRNAPVRVKEIVSLLLDWNTGRTPRLRKLLRHTCKDSESTTYISSQIGLYFSSRVQPVLSRAKKLNFDILDDIELLYYYSYEWRLYQGDGFVIKDIESCGVPSVTEAAISPWGDFFTLIDRDDHRLIKAACRLLDRRRDGDLMLHRMDIVFTDLRVSLESMSIREGISVSCIAQRSQAELHRATEAYYMTVPGIILGDLLLSNLKRVAGYIVSESYPSVSTGVLMKGHWEKLFGKFEEVLAANEDSDNYLEYIRLIVQQNSDAISQLESILRTHVKRSVLDTIVEIEENKALSAEGLGVYTSALLNIKQQWTEKMDWVSIGSSPSSFLYLNKEEIINEGFDEELSNHPVWLDAVDDLLAEQEGEIFQKLFYMDDHTYNSEPDLLYASHSDAPIGDLEPSPRLVRSQSSGNTTTCVDIVAPDASEDRYEEGDVGSVPHASHSAVALGMSSQHLRLGKEEKSRKRDKLAQFLRRPFKRN